MLESNDAFLFSPRNTVDSFRRRAPNERLTLSRQGESVPYRHQAYVNPFIFFELAVKCVYSPGVRVIIVFVQHSP